MEEYTCDVCQASISEWQYDHFDGLCPECAEIEREVKSGMREFAESRLFAEDFFGRRSLTEALNGELGEDDIEAIVREFDDSGEKLTFKDVTEFIKDLPLFAIQYTESDGDEEILDALDAEVKELANTVIRELKMCRG